MRRWGPTGRDGVLAGLLGVAAFVPGVAELGLAVGELPARDAGVPGLMLLLVQAGALVLRRIRPALCLAIAGGAFIAYQLLGYPPTVAGLALLVALYSAGAHLRRRRRETAIAAAVAYAGLAAGLRLLGSGERLIDFVTFAAVLAACWGAGSWVRRRQADEVRRRADGIRDERARIARELHDVVTHHVTAMVVQSDTAGLLIAPQPQRAAESMAAVSTSGREALVELRRLLGVLESGAALESGEATGGESRLADLVDRLRRAGQPVDFEEIGGPGPDGGLGLAVHRVVQEGLTNALKHARGRPTRVRVRHGGESTEIELVTLGSSRQRHREGRGLTGLRERVTVFGGTFDARADENGDFTIRATIPHGSAA
ncbi:two-component sensor histidine kinase [Actinoplanes sp. OR16]|uniref:sensor histidine kinase n=1 Tax=Actinoplanes sp. OR16 TaxID=946334 RepID=UPI000F6B32A2|nr:histidine kinase [Actinoplanes sp. OR16]BBH70621.1 two-component sensor histidine kinase [Actinoplanes sp. OR16]